MRPRRVSGLTVAPLVLITFLLGAPALAQEPPAVAGTVSGDAVGADAAAPASVEGFRSARFGMDEADVRAAITTDFGIPESAVEEYENTAERTRILAVKVPDILEGGGEALVSYVLGYSSGKLGQVSVLWSPQTDPSLDPARLTANANVLRSYFMNAGYRPETVIANVAVPEGLVMFRGADQQGRMTLLLLRGSLPAPAQGQDAPPSLDPTSLLLAYLENPADPDVFSVKPGQF